MGVGNPQQSGDTVYWDADKGQYYTINNQNGGWFGNNAFSPMSSQMGIGDTRRNYLGTTLGTSNANSMVNSGVEKANAAYDTLASGLSNNPAYNMSTLFPGLQSNLPSAQNPQYIYNKKTVTGLPSNFNAQQYLASNPDLQAAFGNDVNAAANHYIQYGMSENRAAPTYQTQYQAMPLSSGAGRFLSPSMAQATGGVLGNNSTT